MASSLMVVVRVTCCKRTCAQVPIILLNLLIAVIVDAFERTLDQRSWQVSPQKLEGECELAWL